MSPTVPRAGSAADAGTTSRPPIIDALTGVRIIAALWVVAVHLLEPMFELLPAARFVEPIIKVGFLGVDVFFVLSGFIIAYNYADRLSSLSGRAYGAFAWARFARIYPVHLATLLMVAGLVALSAWRGTTLNPEQDFTVGTFLGNLFMLQSLPGVDPWNWPSWSVSTEAAAYLVFPALAVVLVGVRRRTALTIGLSAIALMIAALLASSGSVASLTVALMWARIAGEFTFGVALWAVWRRRPGAGPGWDFMAVVALVSVVVTAVALRSSPWLFVCVPAIGLFIVSVANSTGPVRTVLASRPFVWGGKVSYSLYLVHSPVLIWMILEYPPSALTAASLPVRIGVVVGWLVAVAFAAVVLYALVEEPARRWLTRRNPFRAAPDALRASADRPAGPRRAAAAPTGRDQRSDRSG